VRRVFPERTAEAAAPHPQRPYRRAVGDSARTRRRFRAKGRSSCGARRRPGSRHAGC